MTENQPQQAPQAPLGTLGEEVDESLHPLLQTIVDNIKLIVGVIVGLILLVGGYAVYDSVQDSQLAEGRAKLAELASTADPAERAAALEAFEAPGALDTAAKLELAGALSAAGEHDRAAAVWDELSDLDTADMSLVAALGRAAELGRDGKHAEAVAALSPLRANAPEGYKALVLHRLAYEAEMAGDWQTALSCWEELKSANKNADNGFVVGKINNAKAQLEKAS